MDYQTQYPLEIQLGNGQILRLSNTDNKNRVLITEVKNDEKTLRGVFSKNGFEEILIMEEVKPMQIGNGMRKHLDTCWDMHVRFLRLHDNMIAIDAEIETHIGYVEHATSGNWISVIYEAWIVLKEVTNEIYLFHKPTGQYITHILKDASIGLKKLQNQIEWKPVLAVLGIIVLLGLALRATRE